MQIIDELETTQRGPYGGGIGHVAFTGGMDMALALRTMIIPNPPAGGDGGGSTNGADGRSSWTVHLQVSGGGARHSASPQCFDVLKCTEMNSFDNVTQSCIG